MPTWTPWRINANRYPVGHVSPLTYPVELNSWGISTDRTTTGDYDALTPALNVVGLTNLTNGLVPLELTIGELAAQGSLGSTVWEADTAFYVIDTALFATYLAGGSRMPPTLSGVTDTDIPRALSIEYETLQGTLATGLQVIFTVAPAAGAHIPQPWTGVDVLPLIEGADWLLLDPVGPGSDFQGVLLNSARWAGATTTAFSLTPDPIEVPTNAGRVAWQLRVAGLSATTTPLPAVGTETVNTATVAVHQQAYYTSPRYRLLLPELPPLRQWPRDDFLGGAPRQGRTSGSTSVQASSRQGWQGTYR